MSADLDIASSQYTKFDTGKIIARQRHAIRTLQDPNEELFPLASVEEDNAPPTAHGHGARTGGGITSRRAAARGLVCRCCAMVWRTATAQHASL